MDSVGTVARGCLSGASLDEGSLILLRTILGCSSDLSGMAFAGVDDTDEVAEDEDEFAAAAVDDDDSDDDDADESLCEAEGLEALVYEVTAVEVVVAVVLGVTDLLF